MDTGNLLLLVAAGLLSGAMNAAAGGGSFITIPAFIYAGIPAIAANASSTVALFPGGVASAWAFRGDVKPFEGVSLPLMLLLTFCGGFIGALLLLYTPAAGFNILLPWLLLTGSLAFAFGRQLGNLLRKKFRIGPLAVQAGQLLLGIYGGYFGGAVGIMMMAVWSVFGLSDIRVINANKTLLVAAANLIPVIVFIIAGKVCWQPTFAMLSGTIIGGYWFARFTQRLNPRHLRTAICVVNFLLTVLFFFRVYG